MGRRQRLPSVALACWTVASCNPTAQPTSVPPRRAETNATQVASSNAPPAPPTPPSDASPDALPDAPPEPLANLDPFTYIPVEGHGDAVVSLPLGTRDERPILVAAHGNYDTPEWQCQIWREIVKNDAFVLCPRGVQRGDSPSRTDLRYQYVSNQHLEKEIDAAVESLRRTFPAYVNTGPMVYTGFSQGAIMGAAIMARHPERYPRAVLIEGGNRAWYGANARKFAESGGKKMLFACGQWVCKQQSETALKGLVKVGVDARIVFSKGQGHTYGGTVATDIAAMFDWLVEDDPTWEHRRLK